MYSAKIKSLYEEYGELIEFCRSNGQVSFELYINEKKSSIYCTQIFHFIFVQF